MPAVTTSSSTVPATTSSTSDPPPRAPPEYAPLPLTRLPTGPLNTVPLLTLLSLLPSSLLAFLHRYLSDSPLPLPPLPPFPTTTPSSTTPITSASGTLMPPSSLSYTARRHLLSAHTHRYLKSLTHISALLKAFLFVPPHRTCSQLTETSELVKVSLSNIHSSWLYSDAVLTSMESECGGLWDKREFVGDVLGAMEVLCDGTWGGRHSLGVKWDAGKNEEQPVRGELTDEGEKERIKHTLEVGFCEKVRQHKAHTTHTPHSRHTHTHTHIHHAHTVSRRSPPLLPQVLMSKCIDKLKALPGVTLSYTSTHLTLIHPSYAITLTHISPRGAQLVQWTLLDVTTYVTLDGRGGAQSSQVVELDDRDREGVRVVGQMVLGLEVLDEEDLGEAEVSEDSPDAPSPRTCASEASPRRVDWRKLVLKVRWPEACVCVAPLSNTHSPCRYHSRPSHAPSPSAAPPPALVHAISALDCSLRFRQKPVQDERRIWELERTGGVAGQRQR